MADGSGSTSAVARVLRSKELRRVEAGFVVFSFSEHATWLAILVYALQRSGPRAVGVVAVVQVLPSVLLSPFAAYAGDRFPPRRVIAVSYAVQCVSMVATALAMWNGALIPTFVFATCASTCMVFNRPVMGSLLPSLTHAPSDLIAANAVTGFIERFGLFVGPLAAGLLMAVSSPAVVFLVAAGGVAVAWAFALAVHTLDSFGRDDRLDANAVTTNVLAGFATLRSEGRVRSLVWLGAAGGVVKGMADVIFVNFADQRLGGGGGQTGLLAAAYGIGAMAGAVAVTRLVRDGRVTRYFAVAAVAASAPLLVLARVEVLGSALVAFAVLGSAEALLQITASVTIQREAPAQVLSRVFGIADGLRMACVAGGSLAVAVGARWTTFGRSLGLVGAIVLVGLAAGVLRLRLHGADLPVVDDAIVRRLLHDPVFAHLPAPATERLARGASTIEVPYGEVVVPEGGAADHFFLLIDGEACVTIDGRRIRTLGPGDSFGEIALLRDVPRTATVTATAPLRLVTVSRGDFLEAVTGHPRSFGVASAVTERLLGG
ncbi:MAG: cyclic nucleotide-binding domain-containing protein [Actinomycetota bacterium]